MNNGNNPTIPPVEPANQINPSGYHNDAKKILCVALDNYMKVINTHIALFKIARDRFESSDLRDRAFIRYLDLEQHLFSTFHLELKLVENDIKRAAELFEVKPFDNHRIWCIFKNWNELDATNNRDRITIIGHGSN